MLGENLSQRMAAVRAVGKRVAAAFPSGTTNRNVGNAVFTGSRVGRQVAGGASSGVSRFSSTTSATRFMVVLRSIAARWIHLNASGSVI